MPSLIPLARRLAPLSALFLLPVLAGCSTAVMDPAGDVARQQSHLILWATGLMLLIIVPVMALTVLFAWRYRETNTEAEYRPDWDHSTGLELVIWSAPLLIIIALGAITWVSTHTLDPYRPLGRIKEGAFGTAAAKARPLEVQVVSLDWKWLFIYPEQGIATVNELVLPVDRQVRFRMTSSSVMNTFWVPQMAGMVYTMAGMETKLHGVLNKTGKFEGLSGNYSGRGFSDMHFWTHSVTDARFNSWVAGVRRQPLRLDTATYLKLEQPSEKVRPIGFGGIEPSLFPRIVALCVKPGTACMEGMGSGGMQPPVNDRAPQPGEPKGALTREPEEKGSSPHLTHPEGTAPGSNDVGSPANRNMTWTPARRLPGAVPAAAA
jgi:cytochrome o ubiquinol oxidase subunit II